MTDENNEDSRKQVMSTDEFFESCLAGINYYESRMHGDGSLADLMDESLDDKIVKLGLMAVTFSLLDTFSLATQVESTEILHNLRQAMIDITNKEN